MAYVDLDTLHDPTAGAVAPATWGAQINDNLDDLDARTNPSSAFQSASGTTTSTSYTATLSGSPGTNPSVTLVTGTAIELAISAEMANSTTGTCRVGVAISGATTAAASDTTGIAMSGTASFALGRTVRITGLTAGTNTFTLQYRVTAGTGTFVNRSIVAAPANKLS